MVIRSFRYFFFILFSVCLLAGQALAQNISGVINTYARAIAFDYCQNTVTIADTSGFRVGDTILLLQMTGCDVDTTNTSYFGKPGGAVAGQGEFNVIASIPNATTLRFLNQIRWQPDLTGVCQVIRVPQYSNVVVSGTVTAKPWDGSTGGVLVFMASGIVTLNADIDVSGRGFRGGSVSLNGGGISLQSFYCNGFSGLAGYKGEGIATNILPAQDAGRGAAAGGGGGGNSHNSGGGGGSFSGYGGQGGDQSNASLMRDNTGGRGGWQDIGGHPILGGGGGGGHQNDSHGSDGANGGGMAIIFAKQITSNGHAIRAEGLAAMPSNGDGAGGGGAGGPIYLLTSSVQSSVEVSADGGAGGDADAGGGKYGYGPGGGGSAGIIYTICQIKQWHAIGGASGKVRNCTDLTINGSAYGASAGMPGDTIATALTSPFLFWPNPFQLPVCSTHSLAACAGDTLQISASGGDSYSWSPAAGLLDPTSSQQSVSPKSTTVYEVDIKRGACTYKDTVHVEVLPQPQVAFSGPTAACSGTTATYSIPQEPNTTYIWQVTGGTPAIGTGASIDVAWNTPGTQTVAIQASNGKCSNTISKHITVGAPVTPSILGFTSICQGESTVLAADAKYASYHWHPGDQTDSAITVTSSGIYTLDVTSTGGCPGTSSAHTVTVNPLPVVSINATLTLLEKPGDQNTLSAVGLPFTKYLWSTGETTDIITVSNPGTYTLTVTDANGCSSTATIDIIDAASLPAVELGIQTIQAYAGDHIILPISIITSRNLDKGAATDYQYTIHFNKSLLAPVQPYVSTTVNGRWRSVTKQGIRTATLAPSTLDQLELIAALGDTTATPIYFDSIVWSNGKAIRTTLDSGQFVLLGICHAGGTRLFSEDGRVLLSASRPNPVHDFGTLDYSLAEPGSTVLLIRDMLGRTVRTIIDGDAIPGDYHAVVDATSLPNGMYDVILRTPTQSFHSKMEVFH